MEPTGPERELSTVELVKRAVEESKLLVKAEVLHAKQEVKEELIATAWSGGLFGAAVALALSGLSVLFVMIALALPLPEVGACAIVGGALLLIAAALAFFAYQRLPKQPMERTRKSLRADISLAKERLA